jgi:hypothetical protein
MKERAKWIVLGFGFMVGIQGDRKKPGEICA